MAYAATAVFVAWGWTMSERTKERHEAARELANATMSLSLRTVPSKAAECVALCGIELRDALDHVDTVDSLLAEALEELRPRMVFEIDATRTTRWCQECKLDYISTGKHAPTCIIARMEAALAAGSVKDVDVSQRTYVPQVRAVPAGCAVCCDIVLSLGPDEHYACGKSGLRPVLTADAELGPPPDWCPKRARK